MKLVIVLIVIILVLVGWLISKDSFEERREKNISEMEKLIGEADYKCCINPPCTMCYLGNWIWDDGTCDCDGEIAKGNWDNVCPECKGGMEKGECESDLAPGTCEIN